LIENLIAEMATVRYLRNFKPDIHRTGLELLYLREIAMPHEDRGSIEFQEGFDPVINGAYEILDTLTGLILIVLNFLFRVNRPDQAVKDRIPVKEFRGRELPKIKPVYLPCNLP